jgi:hypothetical protein
MVAGTESKKARAKRNHATAIFLPREPQRVSEQIPWDAESTLTHWLTIRCAIDGAARIHVLGNPVP